MASGASAASKSEPSASGVSAGELLEQLHDARGGRDGDARVDPALEPLGRLAGQLVATCRARDRHRIEVRGLDEHAGGAGADLGGGAAHHACQPDRTGVVGDQQVFLVQRARLPVERHQLLPWVRAAHDDSAPQFVEVVAVDRLTEFEHHVVGDVDDQRDRPDARELEPRDHPGRRRTVASTSRTTRVTNTLAPDRPRMRSGRRRSR